MGPAAPEELRPLSSGRGVTSPAASPTQPDLEALRYAQIGLSSTAMIRYSLKCAEGHTFDSWFASSEAFDTLKAKGQVSCAICGSAEIEKALMAPKVASDGELAVPSSEIEKKVAEMRAHVEANSENVGRRFVDEARAMHEGDVPQRAIHGEAKVEEAKKLVEEGVPVVPLPFAPTRKVN